MAGAARSSPYSRIFPCSIAGVTKARKGQRDREYPSQAVSPQSSDWLYNARVRQTSYDLIWSVIAEEFLAVHQEQYNR